MANDLIPPSPEELAYIEEQRRRLQNVGLAPRPDALTAESMALRGRAGAPAEPPVTPGAPAAPEAGARPGFFRPFPEWQSEAYGARAEEQAPGAGVARYQPPAPGEETGYPEFMARYTAPGGQREYEQVRPGLAPVPWIRPIAGTRGLDSRVPTDRVPAGVQTQKAMEERQLKVFKARESVKKIKTITVGGTKSTQQMGLTDLERYKKMLQSQKAEMPVTRERWFSIRANVPADLKGATDINDLLRRVDEAIRGWGKRRLGGKVPAKDSLGILGG